MISKGNTHTNGAKLADYMALAKEGERAEVWQLRGFAATNIKDALRDVQIMAQGTRAQKPFFHVQVRNREGETLTRQQWEEAADRIEKVLGLTGQPRAITFHTYNHNDDEHMHVAWSRIDEELMKAKPLPFFKQRLKAISRELEEEFGLTPVPNERKGEIKYAPTRDEDEQARRLGMDVHEVRNAIRDCWDRSDCGTAFQAALEHEGMILAQGDRRSFVVIDQGGGIHSLSKRILDVTKSKILERLSDLDAGLLPGVEHARELSRTIFKIREAAGEDLIQQQLKHTEMDGPAGSPVWDRDRADSAWQQSVIDAAIRQDAIGQDLQAARAETTKTVGDRKEIVEWEQVSDVPADNVRRTEPEAIEAELKEKERSQSARQEANQNRLRGTTLEIREAYDESRSAPAFVRELAKRGLFLAVVSAGERVNEDEHENDKREELANLNRMKEQGVWTVASGGAAELTLRQRDSAERSYDNYRHRFEGTTPLGFSSYVADIQSKSANRIDKLTRSAATLDFADGGQHNDAREKQHGRVSAREGTFVVINQKGNVYHLNERTTGDNADSLAKFTASLDPAKFASVTATREFIEVQKQDRRAEFEAVRHARHVKAGKYSGRKMGNEHKAAPAAIAKAPRKIATAGMNVITQLFESVVSFIVPDTPKSPEQIRAAHARHEQEAAAHEIDWKKYIYDNDHDRIAAVQQEMLRQQENDNERWQREQRERGGRDR